MKTLTAKDAKCGFGRLIDLARDDSAGTWSIVAGISTCVEIAARIGRLLKAGMSLRMQEALNLWTVNQHPEKLAAIQTIKAAA
jgi:hypothetical protein